ncbi:ParB/RepB/Spo0J family partition protein [Clostridium gasigenes]|uniref:ParB/RepB/Spo0J family partition protein n=1 Tax=Clostridium gasigenes TaxID=94869 RepID=UPI001A9AF629|nr:ParB N-terminal domain-containing protein [Clostridium gasigenes]
MSYLEGLAERVNSIGAKENFKLLEVDIELLIPSSKNFYGIREVEDLADSIKENGLMHNLVVRKKDDGKYEILSGERRYHALKVLKYKKVPCQVKVLSDLEAEILLIQANANQRELTHVEKMQGINRLKEIYDLKRANGDKLPKGKTRDLIGKDIGLSGVQVGRYTKVSEKLIEPLKEKLQGGNITLTQATTLSSLKKEEQGYILNSIKDLDAKNSKQEVDILVEGIKQPVENKKDKEFIKEIYQDIKVPRKTIKETTVVVEEDHKVEPEECCNEYEELKAMLIEDPRPKIVISNEYFESISFTQEVKLDKDYIEATATGFSRTNHIKIKVSSFKKVDEVVLLDNKTLTPNKAYEIAPGAYLWFMR